MWINREISNSISKNSDYVQILIGPRQCGKTSLFLKLNPDFIELSLDDLNIRHLAQNSPEMLIDQYSNQKIFIDEVQYAPNIFSVIKRRVDLLKRQDVKKTDVCFRLTGSNLILMDKNVKETLVGRSSYFFLNTLTISEILANIDTTISFIILNGGWPEIYANTNINPKKYLDDYIVSYLEKDIVLTAGIQKSYDFMKFMRILAARTGYELNVSEIAKIIGVSAESIREWVSILAKMHIIALVDPFYSNNSKRLIKSPKIFFLDTGIASRLQGWSSIEPLMVSPQAGFLFETLVFSEIYKFITNYALNWKIYHWRSRDGEEIDFLIEQDNKDYLFIEVKIAIQKLNDLKNYPEVKKVFPKKIPHCILCHMSGDKILGDNVPISCLKEFLLQQI